LYRQQNCRQFVARLLLDTKGYKSTVNILYPERRNEQLVSDDMFPSTYMYRVARPGHMFPGDMIVSRSKRGTMRAAHIDARHAPVASVCGMEHGNGREPRVVLVRLQQFCDIVPEMNAVVYECTSVFSE